MSTEQFCLFVETYTYAEIGKEANERQYFEFRDKNKNY